MHIILKINEVQLEINYVFTQILMIFFNAGNIKLILLTKAMQFDRLIKKRGAFKMNLFISIVITTIAVSYGWGMRGALIGGEKGAVLPGALLGMFLALFSGNEIVKENFWLFAAAGGLGMAYGGFETYAQTMGFVLHHEEKSFAPKKGYLGLMLKGGLWFGICAAILGMVFSAVTGVYYKWYEIVICFALIPVIQAIGVKIFNKPYDKENKKFPKIYFSKDRREEWGGNLLMLILLLAFSAVKGDFYALLFSLTGVIGGAIGWVIGIFLYDFVSHPMKNGKHFFGKWQTNGFIDGWKIMEFALGAVGGLFLAAFFFLTKDSLLKDRLDIINANSQLWQPLGNFSKPASIISALLIFATWLQYVLIRKSNKKLDIHKIELVERPMLLVVTLIFTFLGSVETAQVVSFFMLVHLGLEQVIFDRSEALARKERIIICSLCAVTEIAMLICCFFYVKWSPFACVLMYGFGYTLLENIIRLVKRKGFNDSTANVNLFFLLQSCFLAVVVYLIK